MRIHSYWNLLIFCGFLSQGVSILSDDNIEESLRLHSRKKRVIDNTATGGLPIHLSMARYIVNILRNGVSHCAGTILDEDIIISTSFCVSESGATYTILSNSRLRNNGTPHRIIRKSFNAPLGFVVFQITPPIELHHGLNIKVDLFLGTIPQYASAYFSGWGCTGLDHRNLPIFPEHLMQTKLPIITHQECSVRFGVLLPNDQICTFDSSRRRAACLGDEGGPLMYNDRLLGLLILRGYPTWEYPDTFFNFNSLHAHDLVNLHTNIVRGHHL